MAGHVLKRRRLANAGRRWRMTPNQIKFFGTKRQKAAQRNRRRHNRGRRNQGVVTQAEHAAERAIETVERAAEDAIGAVTHAVNRGRNRGRAPNVGEILTVVPANPGRRRNRGHMAARTRNRRRTNRARNRGPARNRARNRTRTYRRRRRTANPRVIVRYRNRARRHNRHGRRRNPDFLGGDFGKVLALLGGAAVTSIITGFLPTTMTSGYMGYVTTGVTAVVAGQVAGRAMGKRQMGTWITVGGLLIVGLQLLQQFFPHLSLPLFTTGSTAAMTAATAAANGTATSGGTSGLGLITSSNFFVPQVNMPGSMASFVNPAAIPAATPVVVPSGSLSGLGQGAQPILGLRTMRRTGRMR